MSAKRGARHAAKVAGRINYNTGRPCKQGHLAPRLTSTGHCYECSRICSLARARANPGEWARRSRAQYHANPGKRYGLTAEQYEALIIAHGNKCAICRVAPRAMRHAIDHSHKTGRVRGLLCDACNRGLGYFKESPHFLRQAAVYLERADWLLS